MSDSRAEPYRVLARKYRPKTFAELIGQEAMVRTLTNAIAADRLPHAFILTGVRGIGKTSTARIIARALNCVGPDGASGPTASPCGVCEHCTAIAEDRHVDVMEMDAASRTGVGDIRELIEGVRYRPVSARYKIYIIDEVHMLSNAAFNALLKTLEEPPEHVKFIFATTETRKVPVTVLSRCQRYDLRRVESEVLVKHFAEIAEKEGATVTSGALALIARAADGSVRDGLSLLDQAIAHAGAHDGGGEVVEEAVRDMLGLADGARLYDLYESLMKGDINLALDLFGELYAAGADPAVVLQDLLELTHWLTRLKLAPKAAEGPAVAEADRVRGAAMAEGLSLPTLGRAWQMLLKGLGEVRSAPNAAQAAEMALVRLAFAAELPAPADIVRALQSGSLQSGRGETPDDGPPPGGGGPRPVAAPRGTASAVQPSSRPGRTPAHVSAGPASGPTASLAARPEAMADTDAEASHVSLPVPQSFEAVVALFGERREAMLRNHLECDVHLVRFQPGRIEFRTEERAPSDLAPRMSKLLGEWTGTPWLVTLSTQAGEPTLRAQRDAAEAERRGAALGHPLVRAALEAFPGATVEAVHVQAAPPPAAPLADDESGPDGPADDDDQAPDGAFLS
jgi:DNA polymerase-3 subunit gamma/tau